MEREGLQYRFERICFVAGVLSGVALCLSMFAIGITLAAFFR